METYAAVLVVMMVTFPVGYGIIRWVLRRRAVPDHTRRARAARRARRINGPQPILATAVVMLGLTVIGSFLGQAFKNVPPLPWWWQLYMPALAGTYILGEKYRFNRSVRRSRFFTRLEYENGRICPDCHRSLQMNDNLGQCHLCRYACSVESLKQDWADVEKLLHIGGPAQLRRDRAIIRRRMIQPFHGYYLNAFMLASSLIGLTIAVNAALGFRFPLRVLPIVALLLVVFGGVWLMLLLRRERFLYWLENQNYLICPDCHYSLAGHKDGGHCPECGYRFTPESLIADWADVRNPLLMHV